jgi:hypothetical protein
MKTNLVQFTSFYNRHYQSDYGFKSAQWLFKTLETIAAGSSSNITVEKFEHEKWKQFSIIVKFHGSDSNSVIVSAHQDSTAGYFGKYQRAPGADDDGTILFIF